MVTESEQLGGRGEDIVAGRTMVSKLSNELN